RQLLECADSFGAFGNYLGDALGAALGAVVSGPGGAPTAGVPLAPGLTGRTGAGASVSGSLNALRSGLLKTKMPSRSSTLANHMPLSEGPPTVSLWTALSSGEVVKVMTNCVFPN